jgi:O-antigen/teichoic acid export membrane protein
VGVKRALVWMGLSQAAGFLIQFGVSVTMARLLSPYDTGVYAVGSATVSLLSALSAFGLQAFIIQEKALTPELSRSVFTVNALICVALALVIAGLASWGGVFLHSDGVRRVLLALALNPLFAIPDLLPAAHLEREGRFNIISAVATASGIVGALVTVALGLLGFSYMSLAYGAWAGLATTTLLDMIFGRRHLRWGLGLSQWRRVGDFGLQMLAVSGLNTISSRVSDLALGRFLGLEALGMFNRAAGLQSLLWNNIHLVVGRVVFVDFAELHRRGQPLRERYLRTVSIVTACLWPAFAGFALLAGPFILAVYGRKWLPAAPLLALLAMGSIIKVSITMSWELFTATGNLRAQTRVEYIRSLVSLSAFVLGCLVNIFAAAAARIVDAAAAVVLYRPHLDRMSDTSLADLLPIYARSGGVTLFAVGPAILLMAYYRMSASAPLPLVLGSVGLGVLSWAFSLALFRHPLLEEAMASWRRLRSRALGPLPPPLDV